MTEPGQDQTAIVASPQLAVGGAEDDILVGADLAHPCGGRALRHHHPARSCRLPSPSELPTWVRTGSADAGREVLIGIAAAIITTIGVVFSITILALTLASQQFGPRMLRNFIRDLGNQMTLAVFVGTFVYSVLVLGSITAFPGGDSFPTSRSPLQKRCSSSTSPSSSTSSTTSRSPSNFQKSSPASRGTSTGPSMPSFPNRGRRQCPDRPARTEPLTCSRSWTLEAGRSPPDTAVTSSS